MARPRKCRRICALPHNTNFGPQRGVQTCGAPECATQDAQTIVMTVDEYEAIRLIDLEELMQEQAAARMNIARTTVQAIYNSARKKLACCLVEGRHLRIQGGTVEVCDGKGGCCPRHHCPKRPCDPLE